MQYNHFMKWSICNKIYVKICNKIVISVLDNSIIREQIPMVAFWACIDCEYATQHWIRASSKMHD